jgi:hypothetical protein
MARATGQCENFKMQRPQTGDKVDLEFFAAGRGSKGCAPLKGVLMPGNIQGETTQQPPAPWSIYFKVPKPGNYTLAIYQGDSAKPLTQVEIQVVSEPPPKRRPYDLGLLGPTQDGDTACSTPFVVVGTLSPPDTTIGQATMTPVGGNPIPSNPPIVKGSIWICTWSSLPDGTYTLYVTGNGGGNITVNDLDVEAAYC